MRRDARRAECDKKDLPVRARVTLSWREWKGWPKSWVVRKREKDRENSWQSRSMAEGRKDVAKCRDRIIGKKKERKKICCLTRRSNLQSRSINMHDDIIRRLKIQRARLSKYIILPNHEFIYWLFNRELDWFMYALIKSSIAKVCVQLL